MNNVFTFPARPPRAPTPAPALVFETDEYGRRIPNTTNLRSRLAGLRVYGYGSEKYGVPVLDRRDEDFAQMVKHCMDFLADPKRVQVATKPQHFIGSYHGKHVVERWCRDYIAGGAFLTASALLGFKIVRHEDPKYPNAMVGVRLTREAKALDVARGGPR